MFYLYNFHLLFSKIGNLNIIFKMRERKTFKERICRIVNIMTITNATLAPYDLLTRMQIFRIIIFSYKKRQEYILLIIFKSYA